MHRAPLPLTGGEPAYIVCAPQSDGTALLYEAGDVLPASLAMPAPPVPSTISAAEFRDRFTVEELDAVTMLAYSGQGDRVAMRLLLKLSTNRTGVDLGARETIDGVHYLVAKGVVPAARAVEILA